MHKDLTMKRVSSLLAAAASVSGLQVAHLPN